MSQYIARRLLIALPMLLGLTILNFLIVNIAPGDPLSSMVNPEAGITREQLGDWEKRFGLDQPLPIRYVHWLENIGRGDFGYRLSASDRRPVSEVLRERIPRTIELMIAAIFIATTLGIILGVISAIRQYTVLDYVLTGFAFLGVATPSFFVALSLIYLLAARLGWFPTSGIRNPVIESSYLDHLHHLILPATALAVEYVAGMMRQARASMLEVLNQDYIVTARSKGLREKTVIARHAFRNACLPLLTLFGLYLPGLIGGSVIVESIFHWPGMGALAIESVNGRDYNMLMALTLVGSVMVLFSNLLVDILYAYADPRIRYR